MSTLDMLYLNNVRMLHYLGLEWFEVKVGWVFFNPISCSPLRFYLTQRVNPDPHFIQPNLPSKNRKEDVYSSEDPRKIKIQTSCRVKYHLSWSQLVSDSDVQRTDSCTSLPKFMRSIERWLWTYLTDQWDAALNPDVKQPGFLCNDETCSNRLGNPSWKRIFKIKPCCSSWVSLGLPPMLTRGIKMLHHCKVIWLKDLVTVGLQTTSTAKRAPQLHPLLTFLPT